VKKLAASEPGYVGPDHIRLGNRKLGSSRLLVAKRSKKNVALVQVSEPWQTAERCRNCYAELGEASRSALAVNNLDSSFGAE
jgi:hypothetical protein